MTTMRSTVTLVTGVVFAVVLLGALALMPQSGAGFNDMTATNLNSVSAHTLAPPTMLGATSGVTVQLDWATPDAYASGHRVLRSTTPGGPYVQVAEVTPSSTVTYVDAPPEGTHYYVVRSFSGTWESVDGNETSGRAWRAFDCPSDPDLRACIRFDDEVGGTYFDGSTYGNDVAVTSGAQVEGITDQAADGSASARYEIADSASLDLTSAITMEMWVRFDSLPSSGRAGFIDNDGQYSVIYYAGEGVRCSNGPTSLPKVPMSAGVWTHVACAWDGSNLILYLDGMPVASSASTGTADTANTDPISLLDTSPGFAEPLDGAMDNVRIWSSGRTQAEICADAGLTC